MRAAPAAEAPDLTGEAKTLPLTEQARTALAAIAPQPAPSALDAATTELRRDEIIDALGRTAFDLNATVTDAIAPAFLAPDALKPQSPATHSTAQSPATHSTPPAHGGRIDQTMLAEVPAHVLQQIATASQAPAAPVPSITSVPPQSMPQQSAYTMSGPVPIAPPSQRPMPPQTQPSRKGLWFIVAMGLLLIFAAAAFVLSRVL
jgi:hypothetical protein